MSVSRKTRALVLAAGAAGSTFLIWACTFPDITYVTVVNPDATPNPSTTDGGTFDFDAANANVDPEGAKQEAGTADTTPGPDPDAGEAGCAAVGGTACDCDNDQNQNSSCPDPTPDDCDDFNRNVKRGQVFIASAWDAGRPSTHRPEYDWDCDGNVTAQYSVGHDPKLLGIPLGDPCSGKPGCAQGFVLGFKEAEVKCGATGTLIYCKDAPNGLFGAIVCATEKEVPTPMGCR